MDKKHAIKKQPEGPSSNFTFNGVEPLVGGLLVHAQRNSDMS